MSTLLKMGLKEWLTQTYESPGVDYLFLEILKYHLEGGLRWLELLKQIHPSTRRIIKEYGNCKYLLQLRKIFLKATSVFGIKKWLSHPCFYL